MTQLTSTFHSTVASVIIELFLSQLRSILSLSYHSHYFSSINLYLLCKLSLSPVIVTSRRPPPFPSAITSPLDSWLVLFMASFSRHFSCFYLPSCYYFFVSSTISFFIALFFSFHFSIFSVSRICGHLLLPLRALT